LHDAKAFESRGIPLVAVASREFVEAGRVQARALAFEAFEVFPVAHPIQPLTGDEVKALAREALPGIVARLTGSPRP
jgi:hypothetical protein